MVFEERPQPIVYIDIETAPTRSAIVASSFVDAVRDLSNSDANTAAVRDARRMLKVKSNLKNPDLIKEDLLAKFSKTAVDPNMCEVVNVTYIAGDGDPKSMASSAVGLVKDADCRCEYDLIHWLERSLLEEYGNLSHIRWVAHNGLGFDFPVLWRRALKYKAKQLSLWLPNERSARNAQDTMRMWGGTLFGDYTSQDDIHSFLFDTPPQPRTDFEALLAESGDDLQSYIEAVSKKCLADVQRLRDIHKAMSVEVM